MVFHHPAIPPVKGVIVKWAFFVLAGSFVGLRMYLRYFRQGLFSLSDAMICFALLLFLSSVASDTAFVAYGFWDESLSIMPHTENNAFVTMNPATLTKLLKMLYWSSLPYYLCLWATKATMLLLYYTLVPRKLPKLRIVLHIVSAFTAGTLVVILGIQLFWCMPISRNWDPTASHDGTLCLPEYDQTAFLICTSFHIATELMLIILPFPLISKLLILEHRRYAMYAMFSLGLATIAVSIGRIACVLTMNHLIVIGICRLWSGIEQATSIIVCCIPAFKAVVITFFRWTKRSSTLTEEEKAGSGNLYDPEDLAGKGLSPGMRVS